MDNITNLTVHELVDKLKANELTSEEITNAINSIVHGILSADNLNNSEAVRMLKLQFCEVGGRTTEYRNHRRVNVYPILSYDVLGLNCEPVEKIPSTQNMKAILR